jgi:hypothetical protein
VQNNRNVTALANQPPFDVEYVHEDDERHSWAIYATRTAADGTTESMIGVDHWVTIEDGQHRIPLCHIPCEVWNYLTFDYAADTLAEVVDTLRYTHAQTIAIRDASAGQFNR